MTKIIDVPDDTSYGIRKRFDNFCEIYDIPVMDRVELLAIYEDGGPGYALRRWHQMQKELDWG